ncbi:hypothetical protein LTR91_009685 [Friedmanniomyces endolithicus]|uniref:Wbp11/ELF5/Saf1 N-terminal domain-containing protein n=1 Tax=Friedmanniomyces endolithicus TaxID=329885 RepID=A0AAN6KKP6_9PEZI|nr:hypothetical protein LTR35_006741 [Friedmanniomyces endolithicus]KAK0296996.1 hypothetical protein LTS00_004275 [Friedmanniomyces endolithicus]KAK0315025.1 hypothetical protein LTR82_012806 [Friedmanniomyces endolithicus]KAK0928199.1 hypothetical protein LTR57_002933 [Friedmanniomyces endolithicus]KAK0988130.1 hypothetical protein LTR91_009685 [Friedmanniomyces endolithicus]
MPKNINPVAAQRKADKQKEIAKSRKVQQGQRNEKLARRNPERLQRQVDELKELEARGALRPKDKETLGQLERDLRGVRKAREVLGVKDEAPRRDGRAGAGAGGERNRRPDVRGDVRGDVRQEQRDRRQQLGKRRRDEEDAMGSGGDTDPEVRSIPMPRDTPPYVPRERLQQNSAEGPRQPHGLPAKPVFEAPRTVYSSAPQLRDLKKEAVRFMPAVVSQQRNRIKGQAGRLLEPEEVEKLEKSGYVATPNATDGAAVKARPEQASGEVRKAGTLAAEHDERDMNEEARRFEEEMAKMEAEGAGEVRGRGVQMEEVEDDGM